MLRGILPPDAARQRAQAYEDHEAHAHNWCKEERFKTKIGFKTSRRIHGSSRSYFWYIRPSEETVVYLLPLDRKDSPLRPCTLRSRNIGDDSADDLLSLSRGEWNKRAVAKPTIRFTQARNHTGGAATVTDGKFLRVTSHLMRETQIVTARTIVVFTSNSFQDMRYSEKIHKKQHTKLRAATSNSEKTHTDTHTHEKKRNSCELKMDRRA